MGSLVLPFRDIDRTHVEMVGAKGANLRELTRIEEIKVPDGFCVSTEAYKHVLAESTSTLQLLEQLSVLTLEDRNQIAKLGTEIRKSIQRISIPRDIVVEITQYLSNAGERDAWAVRSSATAEDLPTASFAGQQDSFLNIIGIEQVLTHIRKCFSSLFTERAIIYRLQNGFDHRKVYLSVVVQKMVFPSVAGILFTADPVTSNRKVISIDASFGLGEAMVSGIVNADMYKVRNNLIIEKKIASKKLGIFALKNGGTQQREIDKEAQQKQALTDEQILQLEHLGRKIEKYFGRPQDIEWCLEDDTIFILQSRPITTLYPVPNAGDQENHFFVSLGHQQMMTDAMRPLGLSVFRLTAARPMYEAGGRLFVDITREISSPASREIFVNVLGKSDPLIKDAVMTVVAREDFIESRSGNNEAPSGQAVKVGPPSPFQTHIEYEPGIVPGLIRRSEQALDELKENIQKKSGVELIDFILEDIQKLRKTISDPQTFAVVMTVMNACTWINDKMNEWLGEKNPADTLSQSVPNNVTSEMGLALLDVADVIRPYPDVIQYLQQANDENFFEELTNVHGGLETREAISSYLDKYGMRCAGEIDITRTRWSEKPTILVPMLLSHVKTFPSGEGVRRFEHGLHEALKKEEFLINCLKKLPGGEQKAEETNRMINLIRNFTGYREYPKYALVSRYFVYKRFLLKEAEELVKAGIVLEKEDVYYLTLEELRQTLTTRNLAYEIISKRKEEYKMFEKLRPPRVITSDGEIVQGKYHHQGLPAEAIAGLPVSSGVVEGRARVILKMEDANIEKGDILVTAFTDPSWTPLFISIQGLVTEVGGLMTHGAVIAREYGLPAVVGVENATKLIKDGQRIRVNGIEGYIEIL